MREILFLILITFNTVASGTNYYISNSGSDNSDGLTPSTAWKTVSKVNSRTYKPGDSVLFERGGIWNENLEITSSGSSAGQITYSAYGSGDKPVFNGISEVSGWTSSGNWTNMGSNVWRLNISHAGIYGRVWINNVEAVRSNYAAEGKGLTSTRNFQKINNKLYVYSTSNPASAYSSIKMTDPSSFFLATNRNYITLNNLEIRGWHVITMRGCSNWIIEYCDIIRSGMRGFDIQKDGTVLSNNGIIRYCNFDTECPHNESRIWGADTGDWFYFYTEYALQLNKGGIHDWEIHHNNFNRFGYTAVWFTNHDKNGYFTRGLKIHHNYFNTAGMNYGRALAGHQYINQISESDPVEVYNNTIYKQAVPSQFGVPYLKLYNNIFYGANPNGFAEMQSAINVMNFGKRPPYEMKIFNNVFADSFYAGMFWSQSSGSNREIENVRVVNNIFYENGKGKGWQQFRISYWPDSSAPLINPQIDNNIFYSAASTDVLYMLGQKMNVSEFNALNGSNGQDLNPSGNIYSDPLFIDPENGDFRLQPGSPAIGAGLTPLSGKDMAGTEWGDKPNIGPFAIAKSKSPVNYYTLSLENEGQGIVLSNGIEENSITVESDTTITMEAIPHSGWTFSNWAGDASGSENPLELDMNEDKNIKAIFIEETYTLTIIYEGEGDVRISPAQESYVSGTMINLEAHAEEHWQFHEWEGDLTSTDIQTSFVIEHNMRIEARFSNLITNSDPLTAGERKIQIYPNPAKGFFSISAEGSAVKPDGFNIIDLSGRIVYKGMLMSNISDIQIPGFLNSGIYIIELISKKIPFYKQRLVIAK